jgi:hypothetical protein
MRFFVSKANGLSKCVTCHFPHDGLCPMSSSTRRPLPNDHTSFSAPRSLPIARGALSHCGPLPVLPPRTSSILSVMNPHPIQSLLTPLPSAAVAPVRPLALPPGHMLPFPFSPPPPSDSTLVRTRTPHKETTPWTGPRPVAR